jgi:cytosine/adenosine deaminase-related metal-dependent hydrolase
MQESPIFVKLFDLVAWVIPLTTKFPRAQRFVVAEALQRVTLAAYEAAIQAGHATMSPQVASHLDEVALQLTLIRFYLRLAQRLAFITVGQYEYASERLTEIGRLLQAWRRVNDAKMAVPRVVAD